MKYADYIQQIEIDALWDNQKHIVWQLDQQVNILSGINGVGKTTILNKVLKAIEQRVGAKLLPEIYENVTDPKQYELLQMSRISGFIDRAHGTGRPTKKERRALDAFVDPVMFGFDDEDEGDE